MRKRLTKKQIAAIQKLWALGAPRQTIADAAGVSLAAVYYHCDPEAKARTYERVVKQRKAQEAEPRPLTKWGEAARRKAEERRQKWLQFALQNAAA